MYTVWIRSHLRFTAFGFVVSRLLSSPSRRDGTQGLHLDAWRRTSIALGLVSKSVPTINKKGLSHAELNEKTFQRDAFVHVVSILEQYPERAEKVRSFLLSARHEGGQRSVQEGRLV